MTTEIPNKNHRQVTLLVLIILLLLRIPYVAIITYFTPVDDQSGGAVYEVGTYLLTAILIWWERNQLADFHMDSMALIFILLFRPLKTLILEHWNIDSPLAFPNLGALTIWAISIGLVMLLWHGGYKPAKIQKSSLSWMGVGLLAGLIASVCENLNPFLSAFGNSQVQSTQFTSMLASTGVIFFYHLGFASINEEPLFRGFLWGYLRQMKWKEIWIWLFQAMLFTFAHVYHASQYPLLFWLYIPCAALLFGFLTWRSRSIAGSMLAHAMINASTYVIVLGIFYAFLRLFQ